VCDFEFPCETAFLYVGLLNKTLTDAEITRIRQNLFGGVIESLKIYCGPAPVSAEDIFESFYKIDYFLEKICLK